MHRYGEILTHLCHSAMPFPAPKQGDKEVVIAAVLCWAPALRFASLRLRADDEVGDDQGSEVGK